MSLCNSLKAYYDKLFLLSFDYKEKKDKKISPCYLVNCRLYIFVSFPSFKIDNKDYAQPQFFITMMDKEDDKIEVIVAEEVELLSSVLGLKGELCKVTARTPNVIIEVTQRMQTNLSQSNLFKIRFMS